MSVKSSTSSSSNTCSTPQTPTRITLSDWIRHQKCDFRPESRVNAFKLQAEQSIDNNNFEDAINFYTKAIELNVKDLSLYLNRSFCYENLRKYELCLRDAQNAIQLSDDSFAKSDHKIKSNNEEKDHKRYRNKLLFFRKGRALRALNKFQEAINALVEAKKLAFNSWFIDNEIKDIKIQVITHLGYDRKDVELVCDQFDCIEDIVKQLNTTKQLMANNASHVMPTNPFKYKALYVNGLRSDCEESKFEELMSSCGPILRCKVYCNDIQSRAVITFTDEESVRSAVQIIHSNKHLFRDKNETTIRYRHTWVEKGSDPQLHFKGNEIAGECYRWRTIGCDNKECKLLHIPVCHHLDQQNAETETVKRKRKPIKFDIDLDRDELKVEPNLKNIEKKFKSNIVRNNRALTSYDDLFDQ